MTTYVWPVENLSIPGAAQETTQLLNLAELQDINTELNTQTGILTTIDADTGSILTSVQLLDDVVLTNSHTSQKELAVIEKGHICTDNTTTTPLLGGATFTGAWQNILDYNSIIINVFSDQNSATDGLKIQWSTDGSTIDHTDLFTILANNGKTFTFNGAGTHFRLVYVNGATPQGAFRLSAIVRTSTGKASSHRIKDAIVADDDGELVKAVLTAMTPGGTFVNIDCTTAGNLKSSIQEFDSAVLGQKTMAESLAVVLPSDQSAIPVNNQYTDLPVAWDTKEFVDGATTIVITYKLATVAVATRTYTWADAASKTAGGLPTSEVVVII